MQQPENSIHDRLKHYNESPSLTKKILESLRPDKRNIENKYQGLIPRRTVASLVNRSATTLANYENENIINAEKISHGKLEISAYSVQTINKLFRQSGKKLKNREDAEVISIFSQKGGVGKSAFTQQLGSMLSLFGKVLIVDLDAQGDATSLFGAHKQHLNIIEDDEELEPTIADLMDWSLQDSDELIYEKMNLEDVVKRVSSNIDVIPADLDLGEINYNLNRFKLKPRVSAGGQIEVAELQMVKEVIDQVRDSYDYILIDCPPNVETCNVSALYASNRILIPLELEAKSLTILRRNISFLERLSDLHPGFNWDNILVVPNKFKRESIKYKALAALQERIEQIDFFNISQVVVPNSSLIDKLAAYRLPVYAATSRYGHTLKNSAAQAKDFTNYFWAIVHEILEIPLDRLVFQSESNEDGL